MGGGQQQTTVQSKVTLTPTHPNPQQQYPVEEIIPSVEDQFTTLTEPDNVVSVPELNDIESSGIGSELEDAQKIIPTTAIAETPIKTVIKCAGQIKLSKKYRKGKRCDKKGKTEVIYDGQELSTRKSTVSEASFNASANNVEVAPEDLESKTNGQDADDSLDFVDAKKVSDNDSQYYYYYYYYY